MYISTKSGKLIIQPYIKEVISMFFIEREMASTGIFVGTHRGVTITINKILMAAH